MTTIKKRLADLEGQLKPRDEVPCLAGMVEGGPQEYLNTLTGEITPALPPRGVVIATVGVRLGDL